MTHPYRVSIQSNLAKLPLLAHVLLGHFRPRRQTFFTHAELVGGPRLEVARSKYIESLARYPSRLVMLCDRAMVLARSDRSPAMRPAG